MQEKLALPADVGVIICACFVGEWFLQNNLSVSKSFFPWFFTVFYCKFLVSAFCKKFLFVRFLRVRFSRSQRRGTSRFVARQSGRLHTIYIVVYIILKSSTWGLLFARLWRNAEVYQSYAVKFFFCKKFALLISPFQQSWPISFCNFFVFLKKVFDMLIYFQYQDLVFSFSVCFFVF